MGDIIREHIDKEVIIDSKFIKDRYGDEERRKPDIYFTKDNQEIILEFQINSTFHHVIRERETFYQRNKISLIWIFAEFPLEGFQPIHVKDIYIPNGNNAFVFDEDAKTKSHENKKLYLKAFFKKYKLVNGNIESDWKTKIVSLDELSYFIETKRPFYFDSNETLRHAEVELEKLYKIQLKKERNNEILYKVNHFFSFFREFKKDDYQSIHKIHAYMEEIDSSDLQVIKLLNHKLKLSIVFENTDNSSGFQLLLKSPRHVNFIMFILMTQSIDIRVNHVNSLSESILINIFQINDIGISKKFELLMCLFDRGYNLTTIDIDYIERIFNNIEAQKAIYTLKSFELLEQDEMGYLMANINEFLTFESAKRGELFVVGNGKQNLVWLANLSIDKYTHHWEYIDRAFTKFDFYNKIYANDTNRTFQRKKLSLNKTKHEQDIEFERILYKIYPTLRYQLNAPQSS